MTSPNDGSLQVPVEICYSQQNPSHFPLSSALEHSSNDPQKDPSPLVDTNDSPSQPLLSAKAMKRELCIRCQRPKPRTCICHSLPDQPLELQDTNIVVLQHPHEFKHKNNRSVPLLDLCVSTSSLHLCVGRRLGDQIPPEIRELLQPPNLPILIFPKIKEEETAKETPPVHSLFEIRQKIYEWRQLQVHSTSALIRPKVVLLVLDATWKFAKEMHRSNREQNLYPTQMLRMALQGAKDLPNNFLPRRFEIRTTPSSEDDSSAAWMCTAECVGWISAQLEQDSQPHNQIYETILRVIDAVVEQHNLFAVNNKRIRTTASSKGDSKRHKEKRIETTGTP